MTQAQTSTDVGAEVADWIERNAVHVKSEWAGQGLKLEAWQRDGIIRPLFGTLLPDGRRQHRTALIGVPRKAGKTTLGAAIALRLLFKDGEPGAEVYSAAADREQARLCFDMAKGMVEANPGMAARAKVYKNAIVVPHTSSTYKVLSAEAYSKHGSSPSGVIFDELHAQPDRELWDVLTTGQGARRQPLTVAITTAGFDRTSICYELFEYGRQVQSGVAKDPTFFFRWWGAGDEDDWLDEAVWEKAQPNLDVSVSREFMRAEARQAQQLPARQNTFRRLYLNQWTQSNTRWLDLNVWDANTGLLGTLNGRECYAGLDFASTSDFAAWCLLFPEADGTVKLLWRFWLPRAALERRSAMRPTLEVWERQGWLTVTEGDMVDYDRILADIGEDASRFWVREVAYDPWNATATVQRLQDAGMVVWPLHQTTVGLNAASKELERLVVERQFLHGGNPVARWMADNVQIKTDSAGNIKPDKQSSSEKIDGIAAAVNAVAAWQRDPGSAYSADRGLMTL